MAPMTDTATPTAPSATPIPAFPDPRPAFATSVAICRDVVAAVRPEQLGLATPCAAFDVRTLTGHIVAVLQRVAIIGAGGDPNAAPAHTTDVADTDWLVAFDEQAAAAQRVWADDDVLTNVLTLPWTQLPGAIALTIYVNEITVHTWDLAKATGQTPRWDEGVLQFAYDAIRQGLPADGRAAFGDVEVDGELQHFPPPFFDVVPTADDAAIIARLVAWNGRQP